MVSLNSIGCGRDWWETQGASKAMSKTSTSRYNAFSSPDVGGVLTMIGLSHFTRPDAKKLDTTPSSSDGMENRIILHSSSSRKRSRSLISGDGVGGGGGDASLDSLACVGTLVNSDRLVTISNQCSDGRMKKSKPREVKICSKVASSSTDNGAIIEHSTLDENGCGRKNQVQIQRKARNRDICLLQVSRSSEKERRLSSNKLCTGIDRSRNNEIFRKKSSSSRPRSSAIVQSSLKHDKPLSANQPDENNASENDFSNLLPGSRSDHHQKKAKSLEGEKCRDQECTSIISSSSTTTLSKGRMDQCANSRIAMRIKGCLKFGIISLYNDGFGLAKFDDGDEEALDDDEILGAIHLYKKLNTNERQKGWSESKEVTTGETGNRDGSSRGLIKGLPLHKHSDESSAKIETSSRYKESLPGNEGEKSNTVQTEPETTTSDNRSNNHSSWVDDKTKTSAEGGCRKPLVSPSPILRSRTTRSNVRFDRKWTGVVASSPKEWYDHITADDSCGSRSDEIPSKDLRKRKKKRRLQRVSAMNKLAPKRLKMELAAPMKCGKINIPGRQIAKKKVAKSRRGVKTKKSTFSETFVATLPSEATCTNDDCKGLEKQLNEHNQGIQQGFMLESICEEKFIGTHPSEATLIDYSDDTIVGPELNFSRDDNEADSRNSAKRNSPLIAHEQHNLKNYDGDRDDDYDREFTLFSCSSDDSFMDLPNLSENRKSDAHQELKKRSAAMIGFINKAIDDLVKLKSDIENNRIDENIVKVEDLTKIYKPLTGKDIFLDHPLRAKPKARKKVPKHRKNDSGSGGQSSLSYGSSRVMRTNFVPRIGLRNELAPPPLPLPRTNALNWEVKAKKTPKMAGLIRRSSHSSNRNCDNNAFSSDDDSFCNAGEFAGNSCKESGATTEKQQALLAPQSRRIFNNSALLAIGDGGNMTKKAKSIAQLDASPHQKPLISTKQKQTSLEAKESLSSNSSPDTPNDTFEALLTADRDTFVKERLKALRTDAGKRSETEDDESSDEDSYLGNLLLDLPTYKSLKSEVI